MFEEALGKLRDEIKERLAELQLSARARLQGGTKVEVSSPLFGIGHAKEAIGVTAAPSFRVSVNGLYGIDFGRGLDAYEIALFTGHEGAAAFATLIGVITGATNPAFKLDVSANVEMSGQLAGGVMLRFASNAEGLKAMLVAVDVLLNPEGQSIKLEDFPVETSIGQLVETRVTPKLGGAGRIGLEETVATLDSNKKSTEPGIFLGGRAGVGMNGQYMRQEAEGRLRPSTEDASFELTLCT